MKNRNILEEYKQWLVNHPNEDIENSVDKFINSNNLFNDEYCVCGDIKKWDRNKNICLNCNKKIPNIPLI